MKSIVDKLGITPGPWESSGFCEIDNSYHVGSISDDPNNTGIKFKNNKSCDVLICDVWSIQNEEDRANANLIAAAPEMLEALIKLVLVIERKYEALGSDFWLIYQDQLRIIEKASGKTWEEVREIINEK